jgi:hypothetical protein
MRPRASSSCGRDDAMARRATAASLSPTPKRRKFVQSQQQRARPITVAAAADARSATTATTALAHPPSPDHFDDFEAAWLAVRAPLSLGRTPAAWALRDVESGLLPCDARLLARRVRALATTTTTPYDGRTLLQSHPAALALESEQLRAGLERVMQLLPVAAREDPTGLAMAALAPLVAASAAGGGDDINKDGAAERVALAHEELGAVVASAADGLSMGPRLFAWLFDQQEHAATPTNNHRPPPLAAGLSALVSALGGVELASAALERAPELCLASGDARELLERVHWLRYRLGIGGAEEEEEDQEESSPLALLPARLAAALSTASHPDASEGRSIVSPARSNPRDPASLPIRSPEALTRDEFRGAPPEHAAECFSPLALGAASTLDARLSAAALLLRRHAGWPPGAAVRFLRAYPGAIAWDWSRGGACDRAFAEAGAVAERRGGRWPLALRTSPAAVAAALAATGRIRRRLRYLGDAPGALPGVGLRRALAMPEVDFLEACPGYRVWRLRRRRRGGGKDDEEQADGGGGASSSRPPDLVLLGELRPHDRMI